jgi:hypothetical protein
VGKNESEAEKRKDVRGRTTYMISSNDCYENWCCEFACVIPTARSQLEIASKL